MESPPALEFVYCEEDLDKARANPELAYLDVYDVRMTSELVVPIRFVVNGLDMFGGEDFDDDPSPFLDVNIVDFAFQLACSIEKGGRAGDQLIDPGEYGDMLRFSISGDRAIFESYDTRAVTEAPLDVVARDIAEFVDRARRLLLEINLDVRDHPQLGPWIRGERFVPSDEDYARPPRRSPSALNIAPHLWAPIAFLPRVIHATTLTIDFELDPAVLADADQADLTKESHVALEYSFFSFPLSLQADGEQLLWTNHRGADGGIRRIPHRACPLIGTASALSQVRSAINGRLNYFRGDRAITLYDAAFDVALKFTGETGAVRIECPGMEVAAIVPEIIFDVAASDFLDRGFAFLSGRFPETVEKARSAF